MMELYVFQLDVQKGVYLTLLPPFQAQIGKLWPSGVAKQVKGKIGKRTENLKINNVWP